MIAVLIAGVIIGLAAVWVSWRNWQRTREEHHGGHSQLMQAGTGRTRFLAFWGLLFGTGFAVTSLFTGIAFIVLPRC